MPKLPTTFSNAHQPSSWRWVWWSIVVVIVGWYGVLSVAVYGGWWQGPKTETILQITPLPVAMVGWQPLSYAEFLDQRRAIIHYSAYLAQTAPTTYQATTVQDAGVVALTKMVRLAETKKLLRQLHVTVSKADVNQAYQAQLLQNGNADQVKTQIAALYGWSPEAFREHVIRPTVTRDRLQEKLSFDETLSASAKTQATRVLDMVKAKGANFGDLAKQYSEDIYATTGGDLGFINQGEQAKEIDDAAFSLSVNQVSELIHTQYGYHIIKPLERKTVDGQEQVHLLQITFLAPQVDQYVQDHFKKTGVMVFTKGIGWDTAKNSAQSR